MKFKRILTTALATVMTLSLAVPAFAAGPIEVGANTDTDLTDGVGSSEVTASGETKIPTLKVSVPSATAKIIVNPYGLDVELKARTDPDDASTGIEVDDGIISGIQYIENKSEVPVKVDTWVTGVASGEAYFVDTLTASGTELYKEVQLSMNFKQMAAAPTGDDLLKAATMASPDKTIKLKAEAQQVDALTMAAYESASDGTAKDVLAFNFEGSVQQSPVTPWTAADTVGAYVYFSFTALKA